MHFDMDTSSSLLLKSENDGIGVNIELENHISATEDVDHHNSSSHNIVCASSSRRGKTIPGFAREVIVKVAEICEQEANKNIPLFSLNAPTRRAAIYTGVSERTIQRIRVEDRKRKLQGNKEDVKVKKQRVDEDPDQKSYQLKRQSRKGQAIPNSARDIISRVIASCYKEFEEGEYLAPLICRTRRAALYTGVSVRTIQRIKQEDEMRNKVDQEESLPTPGKIRKRSTFRDKIDEFDFHCIRLLIDDFILNKKVFPTCSSLLKAVKGSKISFPYGEDTLFRLLHSKGFNWRSGQKGKKILVENEDIFQGRTSCIRKIKSQEAEGKCIVYLDDKWIGLDPDNTGCYKKDIFAAGGGIWCSGRLIALTEFSAMGMTRRAFRIFRPNANYPEPTPTTTTVEKWLKENLFPNIPTQSLIIMCANPYNQLDVSIPNEYSSKFALIAFLKRKRIKHDQSQTWADLYRIVKRYLKDQPCQWTGIDRIIEQHGHRALRLPVYMSEFNPIELACADIKRYLRDRITSAKASLKVIKKTALQAIEDIRHDTFQRYLNHITDMENYFLQNEKRMQDHYDNVTKNHINEYIAKVDGDLLLNKTSSTVNDNNADIHRLTDFCNTHENVAKGVNPFYTGIDRTSTNIFAAVSPHNQIVYGKTIATPVFDKTVMCETQDLGSDPIQPGPSYLNL